MLPPRPDAVRALSGAAQGSHDGRAQGGRYHDEAAASEGHG